MINNGTPIEVTESDVRKSENEYNQSEDFDKGAGIQSIFY